MRGHNADDLVDRRPWGTDGRWSTATGDGGGSCDLAGVQRSETDSTDETLTSEAPDDDRRSKAKGLADQKGKYFGLGRGRRLPFLDVVVDVAARFIVK